MRLAPDVGVAVVDPSVSLVDGELRLTWRERSSSVTVETAASIAAEERRQRTAAGAAGAPGGSRPRHRRPASGPGAGRGSGRLAPAPTDPAARRLLDAIGTRSPDEVLAAGEGGGTSEGAPLADVARLVAALLATGPRAGGADRPAPPTLDVPGDEVLGFVRRHLEVRCLLAVAPGVLARCGLRPEVVRILRAEAAGAAGDPAGAVAELEAAEPWAHVTLPLARARRALGEHAAIVASTEGVTTIDDTTALLSIERGAALAALGRDADAAAAFREALRLPRTGDAVLRRAALERAAANHRRGHHGRALSELTRLRREHPDLDGLATVVRSLQQTTR